MHNTRDRVSSEKISTTPRMTNRPPGIIRTIALSRTYLLSDIDDAGQSRPVF